MMHIIQHRTWLLFSVACISLGSITSAPAQTPRPCTQNQIPASTHDSFAALDARGLAYLKAGDTGCALHSFQAAELTHSDNAWLASFHEGIAYLQAQDGRHALAQLQIVAGHGKNSAEIQAAFGEAYEELGQDVQAEMSDRAALALAPDSIEIITRLATTLEREKQNAAAIGYWKQALQKKPGDAELESSLAAAYLDNGANDDAAELLKKLVQEHPDSGADLINYGAALTRLDRYSDAVDVYRNALSLPKFSDSALLSLSKVLITLTRYNDALPYIEKYAKQHPNDDEAHSLLGMTLSALGRNQEAEAELRRAVELNQQDYDSQYNLGSVLRIEGKEGEAIAHLKSAVALKSDSQSAHFQLVRAYHATHQDELAGQEQSAVLSAQQSKRVDTQVTVLGEEALHALDQQDLQGAIGLYRQIIALTPNDARARYDLALIYERIRDRKQERTLLEEAQALNSSLALVHSQLGFLDMLDGHRESAESQFRLALKDDPQCVEALGNLGVLLALSGKYDEAQHLLKLSVEDDSAYQKGYLNLGLVYAAKGRYEDGEAALKKAIDLAPSDPVASRALKAIQSQMNTNSTAGR